MTKREFNRATKENWGSRCMASDERWLYRTSRKRAHHGCGAYGPNEFVLPGDKLARRVVWRRANPNTPILANGTTFRSLASLLFLGRLPALPMTPQERAAREGRTYNEFT